MSRDDELRGTPNARSVVVSDALAGGLSVGYQSIVGFARHFAPAAPVITGPPRQPAGLGPLDAASPAHIIAIATATVAGSGQ